VQANVELGLRGCHLLLAPSTNDDDAGADESHEAVNVRRYNKHKPLNDVHQTNNNIGNDSLFFCSLFKTNKI